MSRYVDLAVALANGSAASSATPMTADHLEALAECALGPERGDDRVRHLEHVAGYDVPLLVREIVRLRSLTTSTAGFGPGEEFA